MKHPYHDTLRAAAMELGQATLGAHFGTSEAHIRHRIAKARKFLDEAEAMMVPPSGVEPELPKEPDFESGASTNSAKGALR